ncbi:MAG TPA: type II toxin-antitoxin system RelE/ParE family toxin [Rhodocyclaceae bacterium]|nr:type II toxin-antitoxin system RelE/ParE family toxin [Rhodocyclaceae bacterium]
MSYRVRFTPEAEEDLLRLYDFLIQQDIQAAVHALSAIRKAVSLLQDFPFTCRKASGGDSALLRELIISFGNSGYVALFEIESTTTVTILAVRHQREEDFH